MKLRKLSLMLLMVVAVAACKSERANVTGAYGQGGVLSAQVVMQSEGASAEGVAVSVRGTGMAAVLGADGRFAFMDVPEGAVLDFRRADGIDAALALDQTSGSMVIELSAKSAKKSSHRRGVSTTRERIYEVEGVVRSADAAQIVVFSSHKVEETILLAPETVVRRGGALLTAADILADQRVHVKAKKVADALTAVSVILQDAEEGDDEGEVEIQGSVVSLGATDLVVATASGNITVQTDASTIVKKGRSLITLGDVLVGDLVEVEGTSIDATTMLAKKISVERPEAEEVEIRGDVVSVGATDLVVSTTSGNFTVQTDASTVIKQGRTLLTLADLQAGDHVEVDGTSVDATTILAKKISVEREEGEDAEVEIEGEVVSVGATDLVVSTSSGNMTVQTDASTVIRKKGSVITLAEIVAGDGVEVEGTSVDATTILAKKIKVED